MCSVNERAASEIYLEITALVSESLLRYQHHALLITANIATVAMLARDSEHKHWSQEGAGRGWSPALLCGEQASQEGTLVGAGVLPGSADIQEAFRR